MRMSETMKSQKILKIIDYFQEEAGGWSYKRVADRFLYMEKSVLSTPNLPSSHISSIKDWPFTYSEYLFLILGMFLFLGFILGVSIQVWRTKSKSDHQDF